MPPPPFTFTAIYRQVKYRASRDSHLLCRHSLRGYHFSRRHAVMHDIIIRLESCLVVREQQ